MKVTETTSLFTEALNTMNRAVAANRDHPVYRVFFQAGEKVAGGRKIGVAVYKDDPGNPHDYYTITFANGQFELVTHGKEDVDFTWKVSDDYLQELADNPEKYVQNPTLLDLDWLRTRLGL